MHIILSLSKLTRAMEIKQMVNLTLELHDRHVCGDLNIIHRFHMKLGYNSSSVHHTIHRLSVGFQSFSTNLSFRRGWSGPTAGFVGRSPHCFQTFPHQNHLKLSGTKIILSECNEVPLWPMDSQRVCIGSLELSMHVL